MGRFNPLRFLQYCRFLRQDRDRGNAMVEFLRFAWPALLCLLIVVSSLNWIWNHFQSVEDERDQRVAAAIGETSSVLDSGIHSAQDELAGSIDDFVTRVEAFPAAASELERRAANRRKLNDALSQLRTLSRTDEVLCSFSDEQLVNAVVMHPLALRQRLPVLDRYSFVLSEIQECYEELGQSGSANDLTEILIDRAAGEPTGNVTLGDTADDSKTGPLAVEPRTCAE